MSAGRPSDYSFEIAKEICTRISMGRSVKSISLDDDMPAQGTIYSWLSKHEEFQEIYLRAREAQADAIFDECLYIADDSGADTRLDENNRIVVDGDAIQRAKLRVDTRMRMAGKLKPKKYGDKVDLNLGGQKNNPVTFTLNLSGDDE